METFIMVAQLILGLSILVSLHEFGHFITAKWFGMRVHKFYLFFDFLFPLPNVLNFALFKKKVGDTEYGLGWFPLGGYVSIAGMIDETQEAKDLAAQPEPWEFRAKPAWQRLIVMLGGVIVNVILGVFIFICLAKVYGEDYIPMEAVNKKGIVAYKFGEYIGLKTGDKILKVNGNNVTKFEDIKSSNFFLGDSSYLTIDRGGEIKNIYLPKNILNTLADNKEQFIEPMYHFTIGQILPTLQNGKNIENAISPAAKAGLKADDRIISVNDIRTEYFHEFKIALEKNKGKVVNLIFQRNGKIDSTLIQISQSGFIGIAPKMFDKNKLPLQPEDKYLTPKHIEFSFANSVSVGINRGYETIATQIKGFGKIFSGKLRPDKGLSGPIEIAQMYGAEWDWEKFWMLTGLLSMGLAFMNLLPIPALDGGHAVFLIYEMIVGKAPSEKFMERAQAVGTFILLGLMVFVIGNGIFKSFK